MKRLLLFLTSSVLLLAGCAKENLAPSDLGEGLQTVTFTAAVEDGVATKAVADGDGTAASVNRCIMEVYYCDSLFTRMYAPVNSQKKASFTLQMVSNRTYKVAFWADHVDNATTEAGLVVDKYYTTNATGGLQAIALKGTYAGNDDSRDAFYHVGNYEVKQGGSAFSDVKLKRPFAQMNVITTDWNVVSKVGTLKPEKVNVTLKNPMVKFNAVTGVASADSGVPTLNYEAALYTSPNPVQPVSDTVKTLSMDYLFASETKEMIDIDWKATKANNADVAHTFAAVPYQRNYRTNIRGALLTTTGQWNVTVEPNWNQDTTGEFDVIVLIANTVADAQQIINAHAGDSSVTKTVEIQIKEQITDTKQLYIPDNTTTPSWVFKINDMTDQGQIVVFDEHPENSTVNYKKSAEVCLPAGVTASQTTFNTPNAHAVVSGAFGRIDANTSASTLEISAGTTVNEIYVHHGNVALYGTVNSIIRGQNNTANVIVNIYDGAVWNKWDIEKTSTGIKPVVNLGTYQFDPTGYNIEGSAVTANGGSPATWTVSISSEWKYFAAKEFSNVSGNTITIMNAEELALFANKINAGVNYSGYTFEFGADINLAAHKWNPILIVEGNNGTNLTIDGKSRKISGLTIDREESFSGLFGQCFSHGTILKNIVIENPDVKQKLNEQKKAQEVGLNYTAALIAHLGCGKIDNCTVTGGTVSGEEQVGAIVGYIADGRVSNCTINGTAISGKNRVGGLAGKVNTDSYFEVVGNTIKATVSAQNTVGGVVGQIMGNRADYKIQNNSIDVPGVNCPIGSLRATQPVAFTSVLEENITGNTWTKQTLDSDSYTYTAAETGAGDQIVWNGCPPDYWQWYAAASFSSIDESNKTLSINTPEELALFAKRLNKGGNFAGYTVTIAYDLDMSAHFWVPIKAYGCGNISNATIQGPGKIMNLKINTAVNPAASATSLTYGAGFIGIMDGNITFKNIAFDNADVDVYNGSQVAVILGMHYATATFDNVTVSNSIVRSCTKSGIMQGQTDKKAIVKNCSVIDSKIYASYSYALMVGLVNTVGSIEMEGDNVSTGSESIYDFSRNSGGEYENKITIKGYQYGVSGSNLWVCGVQNALAEQRINPIPEKTIAGTKYSVYGSKFYYNDKVVDVLEEAKPGTFNVASSAELKDCIDEINISTATGQFTVELAAGTYEMEGVNILQKEGRQITITALTSNTDVTVSYPDAGTAGYIFKMNSTSSYKKNANIKFKDIKFLSKAAYAFTTGAGDERYVNDIDFIHCQFTTSEGATPVTSPNNSQPSGLYFENCEVTNGSGYLYSGYGNNLSTARGYAVKAVGCTAPNCKHFINVQNDGHVIVDGCTVTNYADYAIRTNGGNITVIDTDFTCTDKTTDPNGLLVVRKQNATVNVDALSTFDKTNAGSGIHDVQCGDAITITIAGRATDSISGKGTTYDFPAL